MTRLVLEIQRGNNVQENRDRLCRLLLNPLRELARKVMRTGANRELYTEEDVEDAVNTFFCNQILCGPEGWKGKNGQTYRPFLYRYDPSHPLKGGGAVSSKSDFWESLKVVATCSFSKYWRQMYAGRIERTAREETDRETGRKTIQRSETPVREISLEAERTDEEGEPFNWVENKASLSAYLLQTADHMREQANQTLVERLAPSYQQFFDEVNALDQGVHSSRAIDERKILSFHLSYAYSTFHAKDLFPADIAGAGSERERYLASRPKSFRASLEQNWQQPLGTLVLLQEADYQYILFSKLKFMSRLQARMEDRKIGGEPFFSDHSELVNKAYGWAKTVRGRVSRQMQELQERNCAIRDLVIEEIL